MALSRIWSAFIIIAICVATFKFVAVDGNQQIFSQMVINKSGDSVKVKSIPLSQADPTIVKQLDTVKRATVGSLTYKMDKDRVVAVREQEG